MADNFEDITPQITIEGGDEAVAAFQHIAEAGAAAFAQIAEAAAQGDFTGLATLVGGPVAGAFVKAAESALAFVHSQAEIAETMSNIASVTGTSVEQFQGLQAAFATAGISTRGFDMSMGRLAMTIGNSWSHIQESVRTSADAQERAQTGVQEATLNTQKAYEALAEAQTHASQTAAHDAESVVGSALSVQRAEEQLYKATGGRQGTRLTDQASAQLKADEAGLAVRKAKQAQNDAEIKQYEDMRKATTALQEAQLGVQKAQEAARAAAEKAHETDLKDIPSIAKQIDSVAKGYDTWKDHADLAEVSAQNLAHAVIKAAAAGSAEAPKPVAVLTELAALFSKTGANAMSMGEKVEIVQHLMASGFRAGQASAAQLIAVLEKGPEALQAMIKEGEDFAKSGIGLSDKDTAALKDFESAWARLGAIVGQVRGHFAALTSVGLTSFMNAARESIESSDGVLRRMIDALLEFKSALGSIGSAVNEFINYVAKMFHVEPVMVWMTLIAGIAAIFSPIGVAIGVIVASLAFLAEHFDKVKSAAQVFGSAIAEVFNTNPIVVFIGWIVKLIEKFNEASAASDKLHGGGANPTAGAQQAAADTGPNLGYKGGGMIRGPGGPTSDTAGIFALSDGEFVVKAAAVRAYGADLFHSLNDLAIGGFAGGGGIGRIAVAAPRSGAQSASSVLNLTIDGNHFDGLRAPENVATRLKTFAVSRQTTATGRQPSWMR
jgi:hypothetical protein